MWVAGGDQRLSVAWGFVGRVAFHGRVCTPGCLLFADGDQPLSVVLCSVGRFPARRPAHFFASPKKWARKAPPPNRPSAQASLDQPTALRCSQQAAGAELAGCARSDSCAGLPRLLLRCSAAQKGLSADTEPLLERRGSSTSLFTLRVRAKWMRLLPYPTVGCRVTPYGLIRPTMLFNAFRFSLFAFRFSHR